MKLAQYRIKRKKGVDMPTIQDIREARRTYRDTYPGDIYYNAATAQVARGIRHGRDNNGSREATIGLAVMLVNWNMQFYYRNKAPDGSSYLTDDKRYLKEGHLVEIDRVVRQHWQTLIDLRPRRIQDFTVADENGIRAIFASFQAVTAIRVVGAAMSLHLFAPNFFPLWNSNIAREYGTGYDGASIDERPGMYYRFISEIRKLLEEMLVYDPDLSLKAIDEYNFITY